MSLANTTNVLERETPVVPVEVKEHVNSVVRDSGTSFYWAMRLLPENKREAMFAIYAFCREVDDIADEPAPLKKKRAELQDWRKEIEALYQDSPAKPVGQALVAPVHDFDLEKLDFLALVDGMEMDAQPKLRIKDEEELDLYVDRVACAVGRLSNRVFGIDRKTGDQIADALGGALQLTNILRDPVEDAERNRLYFPSTLLRKHGIEDEDPRKVIHHPAFGAVCADIAGMARARFEKARQLLATCDPVQMKPAIVMMHVYHRLFKRLERRGWDNPLEPVSLSKLEKLWLGFRYGLL